jgi:hypothetical protein
MRFSRSRKVQEQESRDRFRTRPYLDRHEALFVAVAVREDDRLEFLAGEDNQDASHDSGAEKQPASVLP